MMIFQPDHNEKNPGIFLIRTGERKRVMIVGGRGKRGDNAGIDFNGFLKKQPEVLCTSGW
jgi:hypothetical protein